MGFKRNDLLYTQHPKMPFYSWDLMPTYEIKGTNTLMAKEFLGKNFEDLWLAILLNYRSDLQWEEKLARNLFDIARSLS